MKNKKKIIAFLISNNNHIRWLSSKIVLNINKIKQLFDSHSLVWKKNKTSLFKRRHSNHGNFNKKKKRIQIQCEDDKIKVSWKLGMKSMSRIRDDWAITGYYWNIAQKCIRTMFTCSERYENISTRKDCREKKRRKNFSSHRMPLSIFKSHIF